MMLVAYIVVSGIISALWTFKSANPYEETAVQTGEEEHHRVVGVFILVSAVCGWFIAPILAVVYLASHTIVPIAEWLGRQATNL